MQFELFGKDYIKLRFLNEIISKDVDVTLFFESEGKDVNLLDYRMDGKPMYKINNFNVTEDGNSNTLVFRPRVVGCSCKIIITTGSDKTIEIVRNSTNVVEKNIVVNTGQTTLSLEADGVLKYTVNVLGNSALGEKITESSKASDSNDSIFGTDGFSSGSFLKPDSNSELKEEKAKTEENSEISKSNFSDFESTGAFGQDTNAVTGPNAFFGGGFDQNPFDNSNQQSENEAGNNISNSFSNDPFSNDLFDSNIDSVREQEKKVDNLEQSNQRLNSDIILLKNKLTELEKMNKNLVSEKQTLISRLDKLQTEYNKDYESREADIAEIKARYDIDKDLIEQYSNRDIESIEQLFSQAEYAIQAIEEQIKLLVEAKAKKTQEIEEELKIGKKE